MAILFTQLQLVYKLMSLTYQNFLVELFFDVRVRILGEESMNS